MTNNSCECREATRALTKGSQVLARLGNPTDLPCPSSGRESITLQRRRGEKQMRGVLVFCYDGIHSRVVIFLSSNHRYCIVLYFGLVFLFQSVLDVANDFRDEGAN